MNNNRGFTLLEILAAIVILGIILTVFFQFFLLSQKATTGNEDKLVAVNIAEGVLEKIRNGQYGEITGQGNYDITDCSLYSGVTKDECNQRYLKEVGRFDYKIEVIVGQEFDLNIDSKEDDYKYIDSKSGLYPVEVHVIDHEVVTKVKGLVEL
ncbi:prepilin-type N-terminal cleavage/methylation domain-containing protein [Niallia oryzisoli]|uniref:prepilin-type N-terminal cleavage/methylation domain-containing protein n=1 Tax=Niallia oryzisoli TaxID=1737571 RepID=UPI003735117D